MPTEHRTTREVQLLLGLIGEEQIQRELDGAVRNEKTFRVVSERLAEQGVSGTVPE